MLCPNQGTAWLTAVLVAALAVPKPAIAARPSESLLPNTTKGYISVADVNRLIDQFNATQIGQLVQDPAMAPFVKDVRRQLREKFLKTQDRLGIDLDDLEDVATGEASAALLRLEDGALAASVILADVTGHEKQAEALLAKIDRQFREDGATKKVHDAHGGRLTVYTFPKRGDRRAEQGVFFLHEGMLGATDNRTVAEAILGRFSGDASDSLAKHPGYRGVMDRCRKDAGESVPEIRWFIEPFGFVDAVRAADPAYARKRGKDIAKILASEGFDAIQGVGGYVSFLVDDRYELIHRTAVFAPPVEKKNGGEGKYRQAARMLDFPNGGTLEPASWIPREVALYASFNWKIKQAFDAAETLADALIGQQGAFQDILDGIREDQVGPQIDLRTELVGHLGSRLTVITDYELPITPQSERWLCAVESTNETELKRTIERTMDTDPNAIRHEYHGHVVWEITEEDTDLPELSIESPALSPLATGAPDVAAEGKGDGEEQSLPSSAVAVVYGHLLVASHFDFLVKVLVEAETRETLSASADYQLVAADTAKVGPREICFRVFSRTDDAYRPTYELIRAGRMPEAESLLGKFLNSVLADEDEEVLRQPQIDGSKLPDFEMVRRYLGPGGMTAHSEQNGWFAVGFMLNKEAGD
ncbi:MAG: hypothetical protein ACC645_01495 [Pirellulales bacterium]